MLNGDLTFLWVCIILVYIIVNAVLASRASEAAKEKGYRGWFGICFWLGPVAYIIVAALPDKVMRQYQQQTNSLLEQLLSSITAAQRKQEDQEEKNNTSLLGKSLDTTSTSYTPENDRKLEHSRTREDKVAEDVFFSLVADASTIAAISESWNASKLALQYPKADELIKAKKASEDRFGAFTETQLKRIKNELKTILLGE